MHATATPIYMHMHIRSCANKHNDLFHDVAGLSQESYTGCQRLMFSGADQDGFMVSIMGITFTMMLRAIAHRESDTKLYGKFMPAPWLHIH